jgi:hypothetical protein
MPPPQGELESILFMQPNDRYLIYRLHSSGISNERMSLEIAIGLACLTQRKLILYGEADNSFGIRPSGGGRYRMENHGWIGDGRRHPAYKPSIVTELYEGLPLRVYVGRERVDCPQSWFCGADKEVNVCAHQISGWYCGPSTTGNSYSLASIAEATTRKSFADGRPCLRLPSEPVWRMEGSNLSHYSRFFYDPTNVALAGIQNMSLCSWIQSFARDVTIRIGRYNGCHIRLTDFRKFLPQSSDYHEVIAAVISESISPDQLLVVTTDEDPTSSFFAPLRERFRDVLFLEDFLRTECGDLWASIPFVNESILGTICQIILEHSTVFMGTIGSTFTGLIHRGWLSRRLADGARLSESDFLYIHCGITGAPATVPAYFEKGRFIESPEGIFSWNRVNIRNVIKGQLAWYREWPESMFGRGYCRS